jgi:hypothetical protein
MNNESPQEQRSGWETALTVFFSFVFALDPILLLVASAFAAYGGHVLWSKGLRLLAVLPFIAILVLLLAFVASAIPGVIKEWHAMKSAHQWFTGVVIGLLALALIIIYLL